jgi:putative nucleotidyltransferase-like protein
MDRAAAELFLASLFFETTPERSEALRNAAKATRSWEGLPGALEGHGVLPLFLRNLTQAGIELPPTIAPVLEARAGAQREDDQRTRLAMTRFLAAAAREGAELTLVGRSALAYDLYPEMLRRLGALEMYVAPEHLARALRAAAEAGLLLAQEALPAWWYRRTGTRLPLTPSSAMLGALSLTCTLHHPSLLLTAREPEVLARRRRVAHEGHALFLLDPLDALLELALSVSTRAGESALVGGRRHLLEAASASPRALHLDQLLDLRTHVERRHAEFAPTAVLARAREWGAGPALRASLECVQMGLGFLPAAREWVRTVAHGLAGPARNADGQAAALFRPDPFERLPQWLRPSDAFLAARYGLPAGAAKRALQIARARHLAAVLGAGTVAGLGLPLALAERLLARKSRRAAWARAQTPQRLSDVNDAWKAAARAEQQKPITPRTISLPEPEEGVARFPDHYKG